VFVRRWTGLSNAKNTHLRTGSGLPEGPLGRDRHQGDWDSRGAGRESLYPRGESLQDPSPARGAASTSGTGAEDPALGTFAGHDSGRGPMTKLCDVNAAAKENGRQA
jgi:hypothetical protein